MRILFLNQYFPPDPSPTARLAGDMSAALSEEGHEVVTIDAGGSYQAGALGRSRWLREFTALVVMLGKALKALKAPRAEMVICMSSPPCLALVGKIAALVHRARLKHWVMDVYPDIAVALGEVEEGVLAGLLRRLIKWAYSGAEVAALDKDMASLLRAKYGCPVDVIPLWPPAVNPGIGAFHWEGVPGDALVWLYSGNLGRAHEWECLLGMQQILEESNPRAWLVIQGGGAGWRQAREEALEMGLKCCLFTGYAEEDRLVDALMAASVSVATMKPAARGLLWPSKLALLLELPRPILWVGEKDTACASAVEQHRHSLVMEAGDVERGAAWLDGILRSPDNPEFDWKSAATRREQMKAEALSWLNP